MQILGFQKTTLLDYPGHVATTVFTGGCNFRCPFCHNGDLVLHPQELPAFTTEEVFAHLKKRQGILDGVCITGGEPTLQPDLIDFIREVRALGYDVKLDTNGYRPDVLKLLCEQGLIDYVAMDIKHTRGKYNTICNVTDFQLTHIIDSVEFLKSDVVPYEFRTTLIKELHAPEDMTDLGEWLSGAKAYFLQAYKDSDSVIQNGFHAHDRDTLLQFVELLKPYVPAVQLRGVD
jgi:pyruvate formate lyase activating enzyme